MKKETVILSIIEILNDGDSASGAIDVLKDELKETYSTVEITNILKVVERGKEYRKKRFSESMYVLLIDSDYPISQEENINEWVKICSLFDLADT